jgi:hypothetical protein
MKESMHNTCNQLGVVLSQLSAKCNVIADSLHRLDSYVGSYALERLAYRLLGMGLLVTLESLSLQIGHKGEGYVGIFLSIKEGITVCWLEKSELAEDKARWESSGYTVLSQDEFGGMIMTMIEEKDWAKSLNWLNTYGRFLNKYDSSTLGWRIR